MPRQSLRSKPQAPAFMLLGSWGGGLSLHLAKVPLLRASASGNRSVVGDDLSRLAKISLGREVGQDQMYWAWTLGECSMPNT